MLSVKGACRRYIRRGQYWEEQNNIRKYGLPSEYDKKLKRVKLKVYVLSYLSILSILVVAYIICKEVDTSGIIQMSLYSLLCILLTFIKIRQYKNYTKEVINK